MDDQELMQMAASIAAGLIPNPLKLRVDLEEAKEIARISVMVAHEIVEEVLRKA
jgi:hypothetical protein